MEYLDWTLMALLGVGSGAYGVLVGAGGGFILSPMLLLAFDSEDPEIVAGTVLAAIALNSILVALIYIRKRVVDYRSAFLFAGAATPGAVIGAFGGRRGNPGDIQNSVRLAADPARSATRVSPQHSANPENRTVAPPHIHACQ